MSAVASSSRNPLQTTNPPPSKSFLQSIRHATRSKAKGASDDAAGSPGKSKGKPTPAAGPDHDVPPKARSPNMLKRLESSFRPSPKNSPPPVSRPGHSQAFQMPSLRAASMSDPTLTLSAQTPRTRPVMLASLVADVFAAPSPQLATSSPLARDRSKRTSQPPPSSSREISGPSPLRRSVDTPRVYVNREPARSSVDLPRQSTRSPEPPSRPAPDAAAARKPKPPPLYPSVASPSSPQRRPTSPASPSATPKRPSRELPSSPTTPTPPSSKMIGTMHRAASSSSALPLSPRETSSPQPPTHRGVSPIGAKSPGTRRVTPVRGLSSSSASHLPLGSTARRPSLDQPRPSLHDIQPRRPSLDVRQSTQSSNRSDSPGTSGTMSARGLTPSPSPGPYHGHRNRNASSSSLGMSNQEHRELIRAAASLLCRELGRSAAQLRRNGFTDQDYEEIEVRMRNLVRLERIWGGAQGSGSNGLAGEERDRRAFTEALRDGYVLCQFMNKLRPGSLVQPNPRDDGFVRTSNVTRFLATCTIQGVPQEDLFQRDDLIEASAESLARVARAVLSLFRITEAPAADRSRIISGGGGSNQRGPYGSSSRATESTPNLALARATSPTSMSGKKKRWSPPSPGLPTVMDSGLDTLREKLGESAANPELRSQSRPPRSPLRALSSSSRAGLSLNDGSRTSLNDSLGESRQSLASSARTDGTAFSSLLEMQRSTSSGQYGTVRTMTTDATSLHLNDDGSLSASVRDEIVGRKSIDLQRVAEESESCATSSSGGKKKPRSDASTAQGQARAEEEKEERERERRKRINLGKAKWPEDFIDSSHHSNISDLMDEFGSITPPLSTSPSSISMSSRPVQQDRAEPLPITPKRPSHRARHSVDNPILLPKAPKIRTDLDNSSPSRGLLIRSNTQLSANGPRSPGLRPRQDGARSPSQESGQRRVPFPRSISGEYGEGLSPARQASPSGGIEGSVADRPRVPRGRFTSEVDASSSRRRPRPNSLDVQGSKPGRSRFESMVNLGVEKGQLNASDINMRDSVDVRQTLVVKEDGKPAVQYQLGNCIGRGQFGSVYRALNLTTGQMVAVKRIRLEGLKEDEIKQLMREVDLVKSLSHPSIVKYEGMARDESTLSIVLEYAENGSLGQTLKAFGKLNERLVASYVVKILDGLHYLHQSHVVHCDLKAANILTTKTGNVKLSDFGVSLNVRNLRAIENERKDVAGTPNWMAPEVIELKGPSFASDIWSLACTIIELLTGRPPYADVPNSMSVMFRIVEDDMPPIPEGCSNLLVEFLHQCFHKDPSKRPTAEDLCEHEWLKKNWVAGKELRQQDSIPFLRRVSTDLQKSSPSIARYLAHVDMPPRSEAGGSSGDDAPRSPVKRNSAATSTGRPVFSDTDSLANFSPREHTFVKTAFGKAMVCRVCKESVRKGAVICAECNLVAHQKCAAIAPLTCDLRAQFLMYAENGGGGLAQAADYFAAAQARSVGSSPPTENSFPSPRTSFDVQQQSSSAATSPSIYPPTAFKSMSPFKRSRSSLGSPEPSSASAPKPPSQSSAEDKAPRQRKRSLLTRSHVSHERPLSIASTSTGHNTASMRSALTAAESFSSHGAHRHSMMTATDEAGRISPLSEDYVVPSRSSRVTVSSPTPLRRDDLNHSSRSDQGPQAKHKKSKDGCTVQ